MICTISIILATTFPFMLRGTLSSFSGEENGRDYPSAENNLKKGPWTAQEDQILAAYVSRHGPGNWNVVQKNTGLARCGKSCRLRWTNHLKPDLRRGAFSKEEQRKVIELHASMGNKWAKMATQLPGRTDNEIKNFWNTRLKKRRRIGLSVYPDDVKPVFNADNPETGLTTINIQGVNDSEVGTSSCVPHMVFNNFDNSQNSLCVPPISEVPQNMPLCEIPEYMQLFGVPEHMQQLSEVPKTMQQLSQIPKAMQLHNNQFLGDFIYGDYACSSGPSSVSGLPPLPSSFDELPFDESLIVRENPQAETNQFYVARSLRSNGYLESIFYPPKVSQGPDNSSMQGELNSGNREDSEQRKLDDGDVSGDFSWVENHDNDPHKDTLFSIIYPFLPR